MMMAKTLVELVAEEDDHVLLGVIVTQRRRWYGDVIERESNMHVWKF